MLISDFSEQNLTHLSSLSSSFRHSERSRGHACRQAGISLHLLSELLTAGMIFILPIIFLLVLSAPL